MRALLLARAAIIVVLLCLDFVVPGLAARADIGPPPHACLVGLARAKFGRTLVALHDESLEFVVTRDRLQARASYTLKNYGMATITQVRIPLLWRCDSQDPSFWVKIDGKPAKVDVVTEEMEHSGKPCSPYFIARAEGWPLQFRPGQTIVVQTGSSESLHRRYGRYSLQPDDPEPAAADCDYINYCLNEGGTQWEGPWRNNEHHRKVTLILKGGLNKNHVAGSIPALKPVSDTVLTWENNGKAPRAQGSIWLMPAHALVQKIAQNKRLPGTHPRTANKRQ